jgi:hypothetical protein
MFPAELSMVRSVKASGTAAPLARWSVFPQKTFRQLIVRHLTASDLLFFLPLALVLLAPAQSRSAERFTCTKNAYTTECTNGERRLRVIQDTQSPDGRYGIVWEVPWQDPHLKREDDGSEYLAAGGPPNFLVRLDAGMIVARLAGAHFGDHARYNHYEITAIWSPDSHLVGVLYQQKWSTDSARIYRLSANGVSGQALDLLPICRDVGRSNEAKLRGKSGEHYGHGAYVRAIGHDRTVAASCSMQIIKEDEYFHFAVRLRLDVGHHALGARLLDVRRCIDDQGPCAPVEPHP